MDNTAYEVREETDIVSKSHEKKEGIKKIDSENNSSETYENVQVHINVAYQKEDGKPAETPIVVQNEKRPEKPDPNVKFKVNSTRRYCCIVFIVLLICLLFAGVVAIVVYFTVLNENDSKASQLVRNNFAFFKFGEENGDNLLSLDVNQIELKLSKTIPLFTTKRNSIFINRNGYISTKKEINDTNLLSQDSVLAVYFAQLSGGKILYREILNPDEVNDLKSSIIKLHSVVLGNTFQAVLAFVVTYFNVSASTYPESEHNFQIIVISDGDVTYALLNYKQLDISGAVVGYYENDCNTYLIGNKESSNGLTQRSNVGIEGVFLLLLSNYTCLQEHCVNITCGDGLHCKYNIDAKESYCGCIDLCQNVSNNTLCGTDLKTYKSKCHLNKYLCQIWGTDTQYWNVTVKHEKECNQCDFISCPEHLECHYNNSVNSSMCDCISSCSNSPLNAVCATDYKTYDSHCAFNKVTCETFGPFRDWNTSVMYNGSCKVLYPFNEGTQGDDKLVDGFQSAITLSKTIPLFTFNRNKVTIYKNGSVMSGGDMQSNPITATVQMFYLDKINYLSVVVSYRESHESEVLLQATNDIRNIGFTNFTADLAFIITYSLLHESHHISYAQLVLVSGNSNESFGILNYVGFVIKHASFSETKCNTLLLFNGEVPGFSTNVGMPGRHVYRLSNKKHVKICPEHLECQIQNESSSCDCKECTDQISYVCGGDGLTYASVCRLNEIYCKKFGSNSTASATVQHKGVCGGLMYPFGAAVKDFFLESNTTEKIFHLQRKLSLFTRQSDELKITRNGQLHLFPYQVGSQYNLVAMGSSEKCVKSGNVYFSETTNLDMVKMASEDIQRLEMKNITVDFVVTVTFENIMYCSSDVADTFQIVIASSGNKTYTIINYLKTNQTIFFINENRCNAHSFEFSRGLMNSSNVNITGRYVYRMSNYEFIKECPSHLECVRQENVSFCGCKLMCFDEEKWFCGSDGKSYKSSCDLDRRFCDQFGPSVAVNVTKVFDGKCEGPIAFGLKYGDSTLNFSTDIYRLMLNEAIPIFSQDYEGGIFIHKDGFLTSRGSFDDPSIYGYYTPKANFTRKKRSLSDPLQSFIFFRVTNDTAKINWIVNKRAMTKNFTATTAIVITYVNQTSDVLVNFGNTYQVIIASNNITTYLIYNFIYLVEGSNGLSGFSASACNSLYLSKLNESSKVIDKSNVNTNGQFVYKLNLPHIQCKNHTKCERIENDELQCMCRSDCNSTVQLLCGPNNVTYTNACEMQKQLCERLGVDKEIIVENYYKGRCGPFMFPYGVEHGDSILPDGNDSVIVRLPSHMALFTKLTNEIMIKRAAVLMLQPYTSAYFENRLINLTESVPLCLENSSVFYRTTNSSNILNQSSEDIYRYEGSYMKVNFALVVTYRNLKYCKQDTTHDVQVVIASVENDTYVILNYLNTDAKSFILSGNRCNRKMFSSKAALSNDSNINFLGKFVYKMSNYDMVLECPIHLECVDVNKSNKTCGCKTPQSCNSDETSWFCASDRRSYESQCDLDIKYCEENGPVSLLNVTKLYDGRCHDFYLYGTTTSADKSFYGDDTVVNITLTKSIPLFDQKIEQLFINSNGFISTSGNSKIKRSIPNFHPVVMMYGLDIYSDNTTGRIYYSENDDMGLTIKASQDIYYATGDRFNATRLVIFTFDNVVLYTNKSSYLTFQLVLATDEVSTYGIFNYRTLDGADAIVGYYGSDCHWRNIINTTTSQALVTTSNNGIKGRYVYKLTKNIKVCQSPMVCLHVSDVETCGCVSNCSNAPTQTICGGDSVTYSSACEVEKASCVKNSSIETQYNGECGVLYNYGIETADQGIVGDDGYFLLNLQQPMAVFGDSVPGLYVHTNGYIHLKAEDTPKLHVKGLIVPYHQDLVATATDRIYVRQTTEKDILLRASEDVTKKVNTSFEATFAVVITYDNVSPFSNKTLSNIFQVVIATNNIKTYAIFNYRKLENDALIAGIVENDCNNVIFSTPHRQLTARSNVGVLGRYVYLVSTTGNISCPNHLECQRDKRDDIVCGCIQDCSKEKTNTICGTDNRTYKNACVLRKMFCEEHGKEALINVSIAYSGACDDFYSFGLAYGDKSFYGDDETVSFALSKQVPIFTRTTNTFHINSNGFITISKDRNAKILFPYFKPVLAVYAMDLFSSVDVGRIFYRESTDSDVLARANYELSRFTSTDFNSSLLIIVTFVDLASFQNRNSRHTFQFVLATDGIRSYGIFNFKRLDESNAIVGYYSSDCDYQLIANQDSSRLSLNQTNTGRQGSYVYLLARVTSCIEPQVCFTKDAESTPSCGCFFNCSLAYDLKVCGADNKTYDNECELRKAACEHNLNITMEHEGECGVLYVFGDYIDTSVFSGDSGYAPTELSTALNIFGQYRKFLYLDVNGFISLDVPTESFDIIPDSYTKFVIIPYNLNFISGNDKGRIYFRETRDKDSLERASKDVFRKTKNAFEPTSAFIITYDLSSFNSNRYIFQLVIVTDNKITYGVFNYKTLGRENGGEPAKAGFIDVSCNSEWFASKDQSYLLKERSNIGIKGRHVYLLSSTGSIQCPENLACNKNALEEIYCGCIKNCSAKIDDVFCGSDGRTYRNPCELFKSFCEKYGFDVAVNISVAHKGHCSSRYPYGVSNGDVELYGDDISYLLKLEEEIPLFSTSKDHLYICTNGFLSLIANSNTSVQIPSEYTLLAMYSLDLNADKRPLLVRQTKDSIVLSRANEDIQRLTGVRFSSTFAIIITYDSVPIFRSTDIASFQVVLVTDYKQTYAILNYFFLPNRVDAITGFYESSCNYLTFASRNTSNLLLNTSNINQPGRHVYLLTSSLCPSNRECRLNKQGKPFCGCFKTCNEFQTGDVCGTNGIQYKSRCELEKYVCDLYGAENMDPPVKLQYNGSCSGFYQYGVKYDDKRFFVNDVTVKLPLRNRIPLPTRYADSVYISSNGYVTMSSFAYRTISFPSVFPVIASYAMDLDSNTENSRHIWYRETTGTDVLIRADKEIACIANSSFQSTSAVVVTYEQMASSLNTSLQQTFQLILASDSIETYAIYIYGRLDSPGAFAGFYENPCNNNQLISPDKSHLLNSTGSCNMTGIHVLKLTNRLCYKPFSGVVFLSKTFNIDGRYGSAFVDYYYHVTNPKVEVIVVDFPSDIYASISLSVYVLSSRDVNSTRIYFAFSREGPLTFPTFVNANIITVLENTTQNATFQFGLVDLPYKFGETCVIVTFSQRMASVPRVKMSLFIPFQALSYPVVQNITLWGKNIQPNGFTVCYYNELQNISQQIHYVAVAEKTESITEVGLVELQATNVMKCQQLNFTVLYDGVPRVFISQVGNESYEGNILTWMKQVNEKYIEICYRNKNSLPTAQQIGVNFIVNGNVHPCNNVTCPSNRACVVSEKNTGYCGCIQVCVNATEKEVCGNDYVTYSSVCELNKRSCNMYGLGTVITVAHVGPCKRFPLQTGRVSVNQLLIEICRTVLLDRSTFHPNISMNVLLTPQFSATSFVKHNSWVENITVDHFTGCIQTEKPVNILYIDWLAYQKGFVTYIHGSHSDVEIFVNGSAATCTYAMTTPTDGQVFLTSLTHVNDLYSAWYQDSQLCVSGLSKEMKINFSLLVMRGSVFLPYISAVHHLIFTTNDTLCQIVHYNSMYPVLPSAKIILSAGQHNGSSQMINQVWIKTRNDSQVEICQNVDSTTLNLTFVVGLLVLPNLCNEDWRYYDGQCYQRQTNCQSQTNAVSACASLASRLFTTRDAPDQLFMESQYPNNDMWLDIKDEITEGVWLNRNGVVQNYTKWFEDKPNGGILENCGVLHREPPGVFGWDDKPCTICNSYMCNQDVDYVTRGGCGEVCKNGGTCSLRNYYDVQCKCPVGFMGKFCEIKVIDVFECSNYTWHNETYRKLDNKSMNETNCDSRAFKEGWHRFGAAKDSRLGDRCPGSENEVVRAYCGVSRPGWFSGVYPTMDGETVEREIDFHSFYCADDHGKVLIKHCGTFFTYKFTDFPFWSCDYGVCIL